MINNVEFSSFNLPLEKYPPLNKLSNQHCTNAVKMRIKTATQ